MKAFNKIGFHTASGGNPTGIGDYLKKLDAAGVPFVIKAADAMTGLFDAQEIVRKRHGAVPHVLVYRRSVADGGSVPPSGNPDVPDYKKEPEKAAAEHWQWHKAHLPPDLDPELVWIETINELRKEVKWADWIGEFAYYTGQMALADGCKFSAFGFSSGTPDEGAWETDGMLRYLESCQANPDDLSVSLHEYSFKTRDIWFLRGDHIGRFEKLFAACDKHRIAWPKVIMTEWGWTHERVPKTNVAMQHIAEVAEYYAQFPEIIGAAIWYLGPGFAGIANRARKLIKPVTKYGLTTTFEISDEPEAPDTSPPPMSQLKEGDSPNGRYLRDVTVPDDTVMTTGAPFTKTWLVENTGNTTWSANYKIIYINGQPMTSVTSQPVPEAKPSDQVKISVELIVPDTPGTHFSDWRLQDDNGALFGDILFTRIIAETPVAQPDGESDGKFVADVTIPDDTVIQPGAAFTKTWRLKNSGTRAWGQGFAMKFAGGVRMSAQNSYPLPAAQPGQEVEISIDMIAPNNPGAHYADWRLHDDRDDVFGEIIYVRIDVPWQPGSSLTPPVSQRDPLWADKRLGYAGSTTTIGRWGCTLTCFAMTATIYGHPVTPAQLNDLMVRKGGFIDTNLTKWNALSVVYTDIIYDGKMASAPNTMNYIDASLAEGRPVSVHVDFTSDTPYTENDQHWVLIVSKDGDDYRINDPWLLPPQEASLKQRYGRAGRPLWEIILSAVFYHSTKVIPAPQPEPPTETTPTILQTGMNINPDAPHSNPYQNDDFKGLNWVRFVFKLDARTIESERGNLRKAYAQYDPIIKNYNKMGVKSLIIINQETVWGKAPWTGNNDWQGYARDLAGKAKEIANHYKRYGDQVAYQIWNEGDKKNNPASVYLEPEQMALIVNSVAEAIRSVSPESPIIFNGMATGPEQTCAYLKQVESSLGGKIPVDAIGIHPYTRWATKAPFDWGNQYGTLEQAFAVYRREMPGYKFWITEIGVADDNEIGSQYYAEIGDYMKDVYKYVGDRSTDLVETLIWFAWSDWMRNSGVVKTDGSRKNNVYPAFRAVRNREL